MGVVMNVTDKYQSCIDICNKCAQACENFKDEHCKKCADICRQCAEECKKMAGM